MFFTNTCFTRDIIRGILSGGILERGDFVLGGFVPGGYFPGRYCRRTVFIYVCKNVRMYVCILTVIVKFLLGMEYKMSICMYVRMYVCILTVIVKFLVSMEYIVFNSLFISRRLRYQTTLSINNHYDFFDTFIIGSMAASYYFSLSCRPRHVHF